MTSEGRGRSSVNMEGRSRVPLRADSLDIMAGVVRRPGRTHPPQRGEPPLPHRRLGLLRGPADRPHDLRMADDLGPRLLDGHLVPLGEGLLRARRLPRLHGDPLPARPRRQEGRPDLPARDPRDQHPRSVHPRLPGRRDERERSGRRRLHGVGRLELHERRRRPAQPPHHLRMVRHLHLEGPLQGHGVAGHALVLDHRLRPVELRLRVQLRRRPLLLRGRRPAHLVHDPRLHSSRRACGSSTAPTPSPSG